MAARSRGGFGLPGLQESQTIRKQGMLTRHMTTISIIDVHFHENARKSLIKSSITV